MKIICQLFNLPKKLSDFLSAISLMDFSTSASVRITPNKRHCTKKKSSSGSNVKYWDFLSHYLLSFEFLWFKVNFGKGRLHFHSLHYLLITSKTITMGCSKHPKMIPAYIGALGALLLKELVSDKWNIGDINVQWNKGHSSLDYKSEKKSPLKQTKALNSIFFAFCNLGMYI